MSNLWILFKATLINSMGINKIIKEKSNVERVKFISILLLIIFSFISLEFIAIEYYSLLADGLQSLGFLDLILVMGFVSSVAFIFFTSIYKAQGILFSSKDYDMLMSLPIRTSTILINKMIHLFGINYFVLIFTFIPPATVYFMKVEISYVFFIYVFLLLIFLPFIPVIFSSIIAFIVSYISSKIKYKNLIINLGTLLIFLIIMGALFKSGDLIQNVISNSSSITLGISKLYPPSIYGVNALVNLSIKDLLIFIFISILVFSIFIFIFNKSFKIINSKLQENFRKSNYKIKNINTSSKLLALIKKEIKRYFSSPVYVLNTIIGPIMILISAIATLFGGKDVILKAMEIDMIDKFIPFFIIAYVCGILSISCTTNSSISLEGKNLWILKSSPIKEIDIFKSKIILNLIIILPSVILSDIIFFISLKLSNLELIWLLLITIIYSLIVSILGLVVNLYFPKLNWTSETAVVKQGISVIIQMLVSTIIVAIPILIFIFTNVINFNLFIIYIILYLLVILSGLWIVLNSISIKLFNKLN